MSFHIVETHSEQKPLPPPATPANKWSQGFLGFHSALCVVIFEHKKINEKCWDPHWGKWHWVTEAKTAYSNQESELHCYSEDQLQRHEGDWHYYVVEAKLGTALA